MAASMAATGDMAAPRDTVMDGLEMRRTHGSIQSQHAVFIFMVDVTVVNQETATNANFQQAMKGLTKSGGSLRTLTDAMVTTWETLAMTNAAHHPGAPRMLFTLEAQVEAEGDGEKLPVEEPRTATTMQNNPAVAICREAAAVHLERPVAAEEAGRAAAQAGTNGSETEPNEASRFRAEGLSKGEEPLMSGSHVGSTQQVATSGRTPTEAAWSKSTHKDL